MTPGSAELHRERLRGRWLWLPLMALWMIGFILLAVTPALALLIVFVCITAAVVYQRRYGARQVCARGELTVEDDQLALREEETTVWSMPRSAIQAGFFNGIDRVVLETHDGDLHLGCRDPARAESLLVTGGVSLDRRVMRVPMASVLTANIGMRVLSLVVLWIGGPVAFIWTLRLTFDLARTGTLGPEGLVTAAFLLASALTVVRLFQRREAIIGADGVLLCGAVLTRFVPYSSVERVQFALAAGAAVIHLEAGGRVRLPVKWRDPFSPHERDDTDTWAAKAVTYRIEMALVARRLGEEGISIDALDRQGRSAADWADALQRIGTGGYRHPALMSESFSRLVHDTSASAERRAAAAFLLHAQGDADPARAAAEACANPALRAALQRAAGGTLDITAIERCT